MSRDECAAFDERDALAPLRDAFVLPEGVNYLDGNSLGALPKATALRVQQVVQAEWGQGLIGSWNSAGWIGLSQQVGDKIATLIGAAPNEVMVGDSTSVNLFKVLHAALALAQADDPARRVIVSERGNFPTDLYIAASVADATGCRVRLVDADGDDGVDAIEAALDETVAVLLLTHVHYRTGRMLPMARLSRAAHSAGALAVWDLAHSAGAVPLVLKGAQDNAANDVLKPSPDAADFAIGGGYKYLNGGPGAPAFLWAHPQHTARMDREQHRQPLCGWLGHAAPFAFDADYRPAAGVQRFVCGTPPVISLAALDAGLDVFVAAERCGGMNALRAKSIALTDLFIERVDAFAATHHLTLVTPRSASLRGSQVSYAHPDAYALMQALIARGVVGDFRAGDAAATDTQDLLRFGFTPLYTRLVDAWDAADALEAVLESGAWRDARFAQRAAVT